MHTRSLARICCALVFCVACSKESPPPPAAKAPAAKGGAPVVPRPKPSEPVRIEPKASRPKAKAKKLGALMHPLSKRSFDLARPARGGAPVASRRLPRVWALSRSTLELLELAGARVRSRGEVDVGSYKKRGHHSPSVLVSRRGHVLVRTDTALLALDERYEPHVVWSAREGSTLAAAALTEEHVLLASEGSLIVLDGRFREVGRLHFGLRPGKEAHDILVEGKTALVLDNIYMPLVVFVIDLSVAPRPRVVHRIEGGGVNPHLDYQWYDRKAERWGILARSGHRCGSEQTVRVFDPAVAAVKVKRQPASMTSSGPVGLPHDVAWRHPALRSTKATWSDLHRSCRPASDRNGPRVKGAQWLAGTPAGDALFLTPTGVRLARFRIRGDAVSVAKGTLVDAIPPCPGPAERVAEFRRWRKLTELWRRGKIAPADERRRQALRKKRAGYRKACMSRRRVVAAIDGGGPWLVTASKELVFWRRKGRGVRRVRSVEAGPYRALKLHLRPRS